MLGSGDEDGVDTFVVEELSEILIGFEVGSDLPGIVQAASVGISYGDSFHVRAFQGSLENLFSPASRADQAEADAVVRPQHTVGGRKIVGSVSRRSCHHLFHKSTSSKHSVPPLLVM
jgi:hypothetical protein